MTPSSSAPAASTTNFRLGAVLLAAFMGWMFDGLEMGVFPLIARPALMQMHPADAAPIDVFIGHWMGIINAAFLFGAATGGIVFGWLGDRLGRVRAMTLSILCYSLFTALTYFAQVPWHIAITRFLAALGMGGEWSLGVALVMEIWPERHRPMLAGVIGASCNAGFLLIALIGMSFSVTQTSWRWVALIGAGPALFTFFLRLFVPESERWQHAARAAPAQPLGEIFSPALRRTTLLATLFCGIALLVTWGTVQWLPAWADQLTGGTMPRAKAYAQALSAFGSVVGCLLGAWLGARMGRRPAYFVMCLGSLVSCLVLFRGISSYGTPFLAMVFVVGALTAAFYGWTPLYLPELFPTRMRATGQGLAYNAGRVIAAFGALQMGALMKQFDGSYARAGTVISLIYLLGMVVIWFAPETKDRPLPA
ncbi:MAG TPA: MFS transporter [Opitutaceae bacterium]|nr:MFS transporter [Opitutaceae bacterium]